MCGEELLVNRSDALMSAETGRAVITAAAHQRSVSHTAPNTGADGKQLADINFRVYVQLAMVRP